MIWTQSTSGAHHARHKEGEATLCGRSPVWFFAGRDHLPHWARPCGTCLAISLKRGVK